MYQKCNKCIWMWPKLRFSLNPDGFDAISCWKHVNKPPSLTSLHCPTCFLTNQIGFNKIQPRDFTWEPPKDVSMNDLEWPRTPREECQNMYWFCHNFGLPHRLLIWNTQKFLFSQLNYGIKVRQTLKEFINIAWITTFSWLCRQN
jgi:hypothetical protein